MYLSSLPFHLNPNRWKLCVQLHRSLQKVGLHKKREPQLVGECQGLGRILPRAPLPGQRQGWRSRESWNQGLHTSEASVRSSERSEAPQNCEDPAEQEDGPFLRTSPDRYYWCHQARLRRGEEDLHAGGETGEKSLVKISSSLLLYKGKNTIISFWVGVRR